MIEKNNLSAEELQNIIDNLPEDESGNKVAPDSFFDQYYKLEQETQPEHIAHIMAVSLAFLELIQKKIKKFSAKAPTR